MAKQILIKFTIDGAIVQAESSAANIRQGDSNGEVSIIASVTGRTTAGYLARVHFERPDGKKANVVMTPSSEYSDRFVYVCESAWFFAVPGQAKVTVTITDSGGAVSAQGTYEFAVAATTVDVIDSTLTYDEAAALEGLIADVSAQVSALSKLTSNPVTVAYSLTRNAFRTVLSGYTAEAFGDLGGYIIKKNGASLTEQDVLEYMSVMFGTETVPFGTMTNESGRQAILFLQNGEMYRIIYSTSGGIYDLYALRLSCSPAKLREELGQAINTAALTAGGQNTKITANDSEVEIIDTTTKNGLHVGGGFIYFVSLDNKYFLPNNAGGASSDAFVLASKAYADSAAATVRSQLQAEIDTVNATQNVVDIVGTKAALLAYVTTNLQSDDKIEVLVDESQNGANTIYSWTGSAWALIGSKAPYYSISQIDSMLLSYATTAWVDSNYMSLTKGGVVDLEEDPATANTHYFGAKHGTKSFHQISDNAYVYRVSDSDGNLVQHNANKNGMVTWLKTANGVSTITRVPFKSASGTHDLAFQEDLDSANAKIAKQESDIQYLYRQVIGGGDLVTATDSGVALTSQPFPLTVSPKALLDYVGGMCQKVNQLIIPKTVDSALNGIRIVSNNDYKYVITVDTATGYNQVTLMSLNIVNNHKYLIVGNKKASSSSGVEVYIQGYSTQELGNYIVTSTETTSKQTYIFVGQNTPNGTYNCTPKIVDITDLWPTDTPTSTSDARIQWLISYLSEHPEYDAGSIITAPVTSIKSMGANVIDWSKLAAGHYPNSLGGDFTLTTDGIWQVTGGASQGWVANLHTKDNVPPFKLRAGTYTLSVKMVSGTIPSNVAVMQIRRTSNNVYIALKNGDSFTLASEDEIFVYANVATTAGSFSFMPMLSRGTNAVEYTPYRAPIEYPIPAEVRALEGYGLGLTSTYNCVDFASKKYRQEDKAYTFTGNEQWNPSGRGYFANITGFSDLVRRPLGNNVTFSWQVNDAGLQASDADSLYSAVATSGIGLTTNGNVWIGEDDYANRANLVGKTIVFRLATPVETDISEYIDSDVIVVSAGGHLEFENEDDMGVPYSATYQCEANP